jgi:uncharacterized protein (UPF0333 family)
MEVLSKMKQLSKMNKKGQVLSNLSALGVGIAGLAITLVVVFLIMSETASNSTVAADANASAAIDTLQDATDDIPGWVPLIIIAIIGSILLGLVALFRQ